MKKPKDVALLADRLANAASTPLVAATPTPAFAVAAASPPVAPPEKTRQPTTKPRRKPANLSTKAVFLRLSQTLYDRYDEEAMRRTKETGRGVTVQQVILDRLGEHGA